MEPMRFSTGRDALDATIKRAFSIRSAAGLWKCGQGKRLDHSPTGEQKQKKRTFDVLPNPAKLISYRQSLTVKKTWRAHGPLTPIWAADVLASRSVSSRTVVLDFMAPKNFCRRRP